MAGETQTESIGPEQEARMVEQKVVVDGAELHVETEGEGLPVVLVHGLGLQGSLWDRVCGALGPGLCLVRVNLREARAAASSSPPSSRSGAGAQTWAP